MSLLDLYRSRQALAAGVGQTTRLNRVLPAANIEQPIPARVGVGGRPVDAPLPSCLLGPIIETYMSQRTWHSDTTTIRSADSVFHVVVKHLKCVKGTRNGVGTGTDIELWFSSPATSAASVATGTADRIVENSYASRTYHPAVLITPKTSRNACLDMVMQRFDALSLSHNAYAFTWRFATPASTVKSGSYSGCVNRASDESDFSARTYHATYKGVTKFVMVSDNQLFDLRPAEYGGWLGPSNYANGPSATDAGFVNTYFESGTVQIGSMAKIVAMGQPWHGQIRWHPSTNAWDITLPGGTVKTLQTGYMVVPALAGRRYVGDTYYFKHPSAGVVSTPAVVSAVGGTYFNDAIFWGLTRQYGVINDQSLNPGPYTTGNYDGDWLVVSDSGDVLRSSMYSALSSGTTYNLRFVTFGKIRPVDLASAGGGLHRNQTGPTPGVVSATLSSIMIPVTISSSIVWSNDPSPDGRRLLVKSESTTPSASKFYEVAIGSDGLATGYAQIPAAGVVAPAATHTGDVDEWYWTSGTRSVEHILFASWDADGRRVVAKLTCGWQYIANNYGVDHPYGQHLQTWTSPLGYTYVSADPVYVPIEKAVVTIDDGLGTTWTCPEYYEPTIVPYTNNVCAVRYKNEALVEKIVFFAPGIVSATYDWPGTYYPTYNPRTRELHISADSDTMLASI